MHTAVYLQQIGDSCFMLKQHVAGHGVDLLCNVLLQEWQDIGFPDLLCSNKIALRNMFFLL